MKALIISDNDFQTDLFKELKGQTTSFLAEKGYTIEIMAIGKDDLAFCMGCFGCWIKKPGECVIDDRMSDLNRGFVNSDMVIYLSPVIFGQFSANIKNTLDRWIPNVLPFFVTRSDGSTMHPRRYTSNPKQIIIGYGKNLSKEDQQLFVDVTKKHRQNVEVLMYQNVDINISKELSRIFAAIGGNV